MARKLSVPLATVMAPVEASMAKAPFTLPLRILKVSGKACGSEALKKPTARPAIAFSGTLNVDEYATGGELSRRDVRTATSLALSSLRRRCELLTDTHTAEAAA